MVEEYCSARNAFLNDNHNINMEMLALKIGNDVKKLA